MTKLHLSAKVPNEGARRLVGWMMRSRVTLPQVAERIGVSAEMIVRMIEDGLVPAGATIERIAGITGGFVRGWTKPARGWWFSMPEDTFLGSRAAGSSPVAPARAGGAACPPPKATSVAPPGGVC